MARIRRVDIAESFRRLKHENEKLLEMCAKQRVEMQQQAALIREQAAAIREMRDGVRELKAMAVRYGVLAEAVDAWHDLSEPLQ